MNQALQARPWIEKKTRAQLKGRLLLVEDEEIMGRWLMKKLQQSGMAVEWVTDAQLAEDLLKTKRYHAVITDICFQGDNEPGLKLVELLASMSIPTVVITSKADFEVAKRCLKSRVSHFLEKPFEVDSLLETLEEVWEYPKNLSSLVERFLDIHEFTPKEKEIATLALKGLSNREIAEVNGNTEKTVKFHMTIIFEKCGVGSRAELFNSVFPT